MSVSHSHINMDGETGAEPVNLHGRYHRLGRLFLHVHTLMYRTICLEFLPHFPRIGYIICGPYTQMCRFLSQEVRESRFFVLPFTARLCPRRPRARLSRAKFKALLINLHT